MTRGLRAVSDTTVTRPGVTTARTLRRWTERSTDFVAVTPNVGELLAASWAERIFLVGPRPGGETAAEMRDWALGALPDGWTHAHHFLEGTNPVFRYRDPDGRTVEVVRAAQWFGEGVYRPADARQAWRQLDRALVREFPDPVLLSSPATTGRYLWQRSIRFGDAWPVLDEATVAWLHEHFGQGRFQIFEAPRVVSRLVAYDARWSYAALCRQLGGGVATWSTRGEWTPQARGFYRVDVTGWPDGLGVGVLPATDGTWPTRAGFVSYCEGSELLTARRAGVEFVVRESVLFADARRGPLDLWAERLSRCRARTSDRLVLSAIRAIILHTIGSLWGRPYRRTRYSSNPGDVPHGAADLRVDGNYYAWTETAAPSVPDMVHPELAASIWGRARARLLDAPGPGGRRTGMLHVPRSTLVGCRADAVYLDRDPGWTDDGQIGRFRRVLDVEGPITVASHRDLIEAKEP